MFSFMFIRFMVIRIFVVIWMIFGWLFFCVNYVLMIGVSELEYVGLVLMKFMLFSCVVVIFFLCVKGWLIGNIIINGLLKSFR